MGLATPYYYFLALCLSAGSGTDPTIQVDGNFTDWPNGAIATPDQRYIYFRIDLPELVNLQKCKDSITVEVDFDNDQKTGRSSRSEKTPGVDVALVFSPPSQDGDGAAIVTYADSGKPTKRSHSVIDLMHAPTYAAKSFEVRASRRKIRLFVRERGALHVAGRIVSRSSAKDSKTLGHFKIRLRRVPDLPLPDITIPKTPANAVRVMSYNIRHNSPLKNPEPFVRIFRALDADITLLQEWDSDRRSLMKWLARHRFSDRHVRLHKSSVGIIRKYPLDTINTDNVIGRFTAAVAQTPIGSILVGSTHLKCCGAIGGSQDRRCIAEARAIQAAVVNLPDEKRQMVALGGDINLVGSRDLLDLMAVRLDADGTRLDPGRGADTRSFSVLYVELGSIIVCTRSTRLEPLQRFDT